MKFQNHQVKMAAKESDFQSEGVFKEIQNVLNKVACQDLLDFV